MSFRVKLMKNKDRLYAAIVEETYNPFIKRNCGKTIRTYGDLNKRRLTEPDIDARIQADLAELKANADLAGRFKAQTLKERAAVFESNNKPDCAGIYKLRHRPLPQIMGTPWSGRLVQTVSAQSPTQVRLRPCRVLPRRHAYSGALFKKTDARIQREFRFRLLFPHPGGPL